MEEINFIHETDICNTESIDEDGLKPYESSDGTKAGINFYLHKYIENNGLEEQYSYIEYIRNSACYFTPCSEEDLRIIMNNRPEKAIYRVSEGTIDENSMYIADMEYLDPICYHINNENDRLTDEDIYRLIQQYLSSVKEYDGDFEDYYNPEIIYVGEVPANNLERLR